ncbi:MAG: endonuclease/exonuclease/phosphatase family protein [Pseudomonadota bacterium]
MTESVDALPLVTAEQREAIQSADRTVEAHRALMTDLPAMNLLEEGGKPCVEALSSPVRVIAWNLERCYFPHESATLIGKQDADVVLLSEVDKGMARTGQRHTTAEIADILGMRYTYGVEFHELDLGGPSELPFCQDDHNRDGWHGNALLSKAPFKRLQLIRLDDHGHWFTDDAGSDPRQPRVGGRIAIAAVIDVSGNNVCFVTTHLESNAKVSDRDAQMRTLIKAVEIFAPATPVIIGGDLNTGNHLPSLDWQDETLFQTARSYGYHWDANADGTTTRPSMISKNPPARMKLDWFCARGVDASEAVIVPALAPNDQPLSDHEMIAARFCT